MLLYIMFCLLMIFPIGSVILNYINYKFKNKLINTLSILSLLFGLYWYLFLLTEFSFLDFMMCYRDDIDGAMAYFIAFFIMVIIDICVIIYKYKNNKKVLASSIIFIISFAPALVLMIIPDYSYEIGTFYKVITYVSDFYGIAMLVLCLLKIILLFSLFIFLLCKIIYNVIQKYIKLHK